MNTAKIFSMAGKFLTLLLVLVLVLSVASPAFATDGQSPYQEIGTNHRNAKFTYELFLTDKNGLSVANPRTLAAGDTIYVEIRLTRNGYKGPSYDSYGIEFRLLTRGLNYNYDGKTLRSGTDVREMHYADGKSIGFAWYDFMQVGEKFNNPVLAASWSYTVDDPKMVNITVPVALIYITGDEEEHIPVGPATLFLDPNGGKIVGEDVSGMYTSGDVVVLPDVQRDGRVFAGWSDGAHLYPAGSKYTLSGIVTLTAQWEEPDRNRHLSLDLKGGELIGEDITGFYADGEIVVLPDAKQEGYTFKGWSDGVNTYAANAEYTVYNTVTISAQWEEISVQPTPPPVDPEPSNGGPRGAIGGGLAGLIVLFLLLLLWKRRFVRYSLKTGDVSLYYRDKEYDVQVEAVLLDGTREYHLNKSGVVTAKSRLWFIENVTNVTIADIEPGNYKGKLIITAEGHEKVKKCRIKVLDRELKSIFKS